MKNRHVNFLILLFVVLNVFFFFGKEPVAEVRSVSKVQLLSIPPEDVEEYYQGLSLYWGDIHGHSGLSDGYGLPEEYFERARHEQNLDFAALSDHAEAMLLFEAAFPKELPDTPSLWEKGIAALEEAYAPGQFVTLPAFEWSSFFYGHRNVYFRDVDHLPESPPNGFYSPSPDDLWQLLDQGGYAAFTVPHHPAWIGAPLDWSFFNERDRLVEIYSKHGDSESIFSNYELLSDFLVAPWRKILVRGRFVIDALLQGHKLGIIAGSDTHQGLAGSTQRDWPRGVSLKLLFGVQGDLELLAKLQKLGLTLEQFYTLIGLGYNWDFREPVGGNGGLCAVWANDLIREEIWDALWDRTTYGTSGIRPKVQFVLRDSEDPGRFARMGGKIAIAGKPEILVNIVADASSTISYIMLARRGKVLLAQPVNSKQESFKLVDEQYDPRESSVFYTLKIDFLQTADYNYEYDRILIYNGGEFQDGGPQLDERTWVSPIWVNSIE
jgi:hypothetical protein